MHIILASRSPRRVELLKQINVSCTVIPADIDESVRPGELAANYVLRLAEEKAEAIRSSLDQAEDQLILAADTTVALDKHILGKPEDDADAIRMLKNCPVPPIRCTQRLRFLGTIVLRC